jgi:hypothetical protein
MKARQLIDRAFPQHNRQGPFDLIDDMREIQNALRAESCSVSVWDQRLQASKPLFPIDPNKWATYHVHLQYIHQHFNVIKSMPAYFNKVFFCNLCWTATYRKFHICDSVCGACRKQGIDCILTSTRLCGDCNRVFFSEQCYTRHKDRRVCQELQCCVDCNALLTAGQCTFCKFNATCKLCRKKRNGTAREHQFECFHTPKRTPKSKNRKLFITYDFETHFTDNVSTTGGEKEWHEVNCAVGMLSCDECRDQDPLTGSCKSCGGNLTHTFVGETAVDDFVKWITQPKHFNAIALAHGSAGFDNLLLLSYFTTKENHKIYQPHIIMRDSSILSFSVLKGAIKFMDSNCYFLSKLKHLPKMVNLATGPKR